MALRHHRYEELPQAAMQSNLELRLSLGLEIPEITVPVVSPWPVLRLPAARKLDLGRAIVSAVRDLAKFVGAVEVQRKAPPPDSLSRLEAIVAYSHLAWTGYDGDPAYLRFLQAAFPSYPVDVLSQWFQRHGPHALGLPLSAALRFERLQFRKEMWPTDVLLRASTRDDAAYKGGDPEQDGRWRVEKHSTAGLWLAGRMLSEGSWPVPPIFLCSGAMAPLAEGAQPGVPLLLEGHTRFSYLTELVHMGRAHSEHPVWVATVEPSDIVHSKAPST